MADLLPDEGLDGNNVYSDAEEVDDYSELDGELAIGGFWGSLWGKFKGGLKKVWRMVKHKGALKVLDTVYPGAGTALAAGVSTIEKATGKNKKDKAQALADIKAVAAKAKGGDATARETMGMLKTVRDAQKEALPETVGPPTAAPAPTEAVPDEAAATSGEDGFLL